MRVDVHAHVMPTAILGAAGDYGPEIIETGNGRAAIRVGPYSSRVGGEKGLSAEGMRKMAAPEVRIEDIDRLGVDKMLVSTSPLFYLYWLDDSVRIPFAQKSNDAMAEYCRYAPDRLMMLSTLPLPNIEESVKEIGRSVDLGARGVNIGANELGDGLELDSEELWPIYEELEARSLPLFVHPHPLTMSSGAYDRYNLTWMVGYTYQESVAFARLLLGGVFDDFPNLKVILTHGGGFAPYQFGRLVEAQNHAPDVRARRPIAEYLPNLYFDILIHDLRARKLLLDFAGPDNLLVGSNFGGWDAMNGFELLDELELDEADHQKISGGNAAGLFALE